MHLYDLKSAALEVAGGAARFGRPGTLGLVRCQSGSPGGFCVPELRRLMVIQRNFDPVTLAPSGYVNGNFFSYSHFMKVCPPPAYIVDLTAAQAVVNRSVTSPLLSGGFAQDYKLNPWNCLLRRFPYGPDPGRYWRLRYLYRASNVNMETAPPGSLLLQTNLNDK